jgi:hypothetical protein
MRGTPLKSSLLLSAQLLDLSSSNLVIKDANPLAVAGFGCKYC